MKPESNSFASGCAGPCANRCQGFTLIEVLISMALLAMISLAIYQAMVGTFKIRDVLLHEGEFYNETRLAMKILDQDFTLFYSPLALLPTRPLTPEEQDEIDRDADLSTDSAFWAPAVHPSGIRPSRFQGDVRKLSFISASHVRIYRDAHESIFSKIIYEFEPDNHPDAIPGTSVLVRTESPNFFQEERLDDPSLRRHRLLEGIHSYKLRYYERDTDTWYNNWDSLSSNFKNQYPSVIEVTLEVLGPENLSFEGQYKTHSEIFLHGVPRRF